MSLHCTALEGAAAAAVVVVAAVKNENLCKWTNYRDGSPRHILDCCYYFTISFEYVLASVQDGADRMQEDRIGLE